MGIFWSRAFQVGEQLVQRPGGRLGWFGEVRLVNGTGGTGFGGHRKNLVLLPGGM